MIIVSGAYSAKIFIASNGDIVQKKSEEVSTREDYSDHEGFWRMGKIKTKKDTGAVGAWGNTEHHKEYLHEKFLNILRQDTFDLFMNEHIAEVYLFAPHYISLAIIGHALHPFLKQRIKMIIDGDYNHHHPTEILKIITRNKNDERKQQEESLREKLRLMQEKNSDYLH